MSGAIIAGNPEPIESGFSFTIRKGVGGRERVRTFTGERDSVLARVNSLLAEGAIEVTATQQPGSALASVSARFGQIEDSEPEVAEETLTIRFNDVPIPIHRHPSFVAITDRRIKQLNELANEKDATPPTDATELIYFNLKLRGVDSYKAKLPVVTYVRTVSPSYADGLDLGNVGKIHTTDQVVGLVSSPILFSIPQNTIAVSSGGNYLVGWQLDASLDRLANGNFQITEVYEFGVWEDDLYDTV